MFNILQNKVHCKNCELISKATRLLNASELDALSKDMSDVTLSKGDKIFVEGLPHSHVIYIREGFVKVHKIGPSGRDQILKFARPGAFVGIQCLFGANVNKFSATALNTVKACFISGNIFKSLVNQNAKFASEIVTSLCQDELSYFERFVDLQQKNNSGKLADAILYFSNKVFKSDNFTLPLTIVDLAALSSTTRESITRSLKDFKNSGIIEMKNRDIKILNKQILIKISENG